MIKLVLTSTQRQRALMRLNGFTQNAEERALAVLRSYGITGDAVGDFVSKWREVWQKRFDRRIAFESVAQSYNETGPFENINVFALSRFRLLEPRIGSTWRDLGDEIELLSASLVLAIVYRLKYEDIPKDLTFKWRLGFELSMAYFNMEAATAMAVKKSGRGREGKGKDPDLKQYDKLLAHYGNVNEAKATWVENTGKSRRRLNQKLKERKQKQSGN